MPTQRPPIEPLRCDFSMQFLSAEKLDQLQATTLTILDDVGVRFPSEQALAIFADHGATVDHDRQIVKLPGDLVRSALATAPRYFSLGSRDPSCDLQLQRGVTYFTTDGCGVAAVDLETHERHPSCKADVGRTALVADYLSSIAFYWPMVSAQDFGRAAPLHELDAAWNNTVKHIQSETLMGAIPAHYGVEMATVIAGSRAELRRRPVLSVLICTIAPLAQDKEGIEGALVLAEAGIPVGFLAMPTLGTTAPATYAGALAMADAEVISAAVLVQLAYPGAPVFHSIMHAWADPRSGAYVGYPLDARCRFAAIEMAHHWGLPTLGGAYGTDSKAPGTWQAAAEVALDPFLVGMVGSEMVTGIGLNETYTVLHPEAIILDDEIYHRARYSLLEMEISQETLALDTVRAVGPGGHFLGQKHTRRHMPTGMVPGLAHQMNRDGSYRDPVQVARERVSWILDNHQPVPLDQATQVGLAGLLSAAERELAI
jgi:trimethylamine--corrinoid protein Co-methyltransferase